ncbi:MAG: hypothetical protein QOG49_1388 [Frankiaceae bacterium]|jgi:predicted lipoprotein with Yx(FWY)xxD motif|nr:hypothetical protein [Frankiaceae bacterium]
MQRRFARVGVTAITVVSLLALGACGGKAKKTATPAASTTAAAAAPTATSAPAAASSSSPADSAAAGGPAAKLAVAKSAKLGDVVVDAQGFTLYRFDKDTTSPPKSNCTGGCIGTWPPAASTGKPAATGVDAALVGTMKRDDGTEQITLGGSPLYRFAADAKAGDTNGQGVGGLWWAVTPSGGKAATP